MDDEKTETKSDKKRPKLDPLREKYPRDFIENKPFMPTILQKNSPRNLKFIEKFFFDHLDPIGQLEYEDYRLKMKYCTGCETFFYKRGGFSSHPEDKTITLDELYHDYGVKCPRSFLRYIEDHLYYKPNHLPPVTYLRLPGYQRYHYTYSELVKGYSIQDEALLKGQPLDEEKLGLERLLMEKDCEAEKTKVDLCNCLFAPPTFRMPGT